MHVSNATFQNCSSQQLQIDGPADC